MPLTTYGAWHAVASILKTEGVRTDIIIELIGHKAEAIIETYLKSFENSITNDAMENL